MVNIANISQRAQVRSALGRPIDSGVNLDGGDDTQTVMANSDETMLVYSTQDGMPRRILRIDAERVLMKRRSDGTPAFWIEGMAGSKPAVLKGNIHCYMHPDLDERFPFDILDPEGPERMNKEWIESIGLAGRSCNMSAPDKPNRADFQSVFDREDHAHTNHRREYQTINMALDRLRTAQNEYEARQEAEERRRATDALLAVAGGSQRAPVAAVELFECV